MIFKYALGVLSKAQAQQLYKVRRLRCGTTWRAAMQRPCEISRLVLVPPWLCPQEYTAFEKQHGDKKEIEDVIIGKRRFQYEEAVKANPTNYDAWFDYARLEETDGTDESVREVYERAIANVPPAELKKYWRRYVYLWINYALYEELEAKDATRTRAVYRAALDVIPHKAFTFAKVWLMAAHFEVRQHDLKAARKLLGTAVGACLLPPTWVCECCERMLTLSLRAT